MALDKLFLDVILTMAALIYNSYAGNATTETVNSLKQSTVAEMLTTNPFVHKLATAETLTGRLSDKSEQNLITTEALITKSLNRRLKFLDNQLTTVEEKNIERTTTNTGDTETPIENSSNSETTIGKSNNNVNTMIDVAPTVKNNKPASMKTAGLTSVKTDAPTSVKTSWPTTVKTAGPTTVKTAGLTSGKTAGLTSVKTAGLTSVTTDVPTSVKTAGLTSVKTGGPTTVNTAGLTSVKTAGPTTVKTAGTTTIKTAGLTSVTTDVPTSAKTSWPTSVKTAGLTSVKTAGLTSVKTAGLTSVKTAGPTSVKTAGLASVKTNAPTSVKTAGLTSVKTAAPTSVKTAAPTSVKTDTLTSVKTDALTSVKTAGPTTVKTECEQDMASIDNNRVYTFLCTGLQTGNIVKWYEVHNDWSNVVATCLGGPDYCLNPDPCFNAKRNGTVSELRVATTFWENTDGKMECRETIGNVETQANLKCEQDMASIDNNTVYTFLCTGLQTGNIVRWYEVHNDLTSVVATCLGGPDHHCLNPDPCFNAKRNDTVSELRVATTFWENTDGEMECREIINSAETQANLTVTLIPPKDTSGHHGGSKTTGWSPNGTTSMSRVITSSAYVSHHTQDMTTVSSRSLSDQHNGEETTFTSKNSRADVSSVTTPVKGETSERTQSISLSHTPTTNRQTTVETTRKEMTQDLYTTSIVSGERTTMGYRETTPSSTVSVMNRNTTTSNTLGLETTFSTTRNSETTENDQRSVDTTEIKTGNGKSTTYATNNSKTTDSKWNRETTQMSMPDVNKTDLYTEYGKLTTYTTSNSKTTKRSESTEMRMSSYETTKTNRWSEDVTTEHTATWDNERTNSEITSSLHRQSSNTSPQTSTFVMSSSVETNSEMTSASPLTGVITETKILTSEYGNTTETSVTNNLATATDVPRGQATPTSLFQGETTFSDHFNRESTKYNAGKPGTTNTMSENVDTTPTESKFDNTTNMTSENEEIVSTAQTPFTKDVSEIRLTASKTVSPSASIGDKSSEYFSTLETSSSGNVSNENVYTTERYTENVSSTKVFSPPTSMASAQKKDDQSSGDVLVAAVAGTFSVLAAVCLAAAIFFACYKSQKLKNRINPEITKSRDGKGGVENGLMQEMINRASRQGRGLNEPNTKNTTDFTVFMAETSLSRETRKPASTSVSTGKGFNDKITAYSFVDERTPHSRNNEHRNIKWKEAVRNVVDESSGKGRPAPKLTLKELAEIHREKRLVNSTPEGGRTVKDGDETTGVGGTHQQGHEVEVYAVVNKKKEDAALLKEKENSRAFSDKDVSSKMTDANRAKNLRDIYAIVDRSKKQDSLETRKNESDEESQALSNPNLDEATNSHLPASIEDEDIKESQLDVNTKINKPKTKQMLKMKAISSEDTPEDSIPNPDPGVCETDPGQETHLKEVIDTSLSSAEDIFGNSTEPVPKPRLKRLRANVIEARLEQEQLPSRRLSVKDFPGDTGNL